MEEGLLQHQNDRDDRRITACVILSTFVAVCSAFSYGCAAGYTSGAETAIMKELDLSMAQVCNLFFFHFLAFITINTQLIPN